MKLVPCFHLMKWDLVVILACYMVLEQRTVMSTLLYHNYDPMKFIREMGRQFLEVMDQTSYNHNVNVLVRYHLGVSNTLNRLLLW